MKTCLSTILLAGFIFSCGDPETSSLDKQESPAAIAIAFNKYIAEGKIREAKKLGTEPTQSRLDEMASSIPVNPGLTFNLVSDSVAGDHAFVVLKEAEGNILPRFHLVKIDGTWKVDLVASAREQLQARSLKNRDRLKNLAEGKKKP